MDCNFNYPYNYWTVNSNAYVQSSGQAVTTYHCPPPQPQLRPQYIPRFSPPTPVQFDPVHFNHQSPPFNSNWNFGFTDGMARFRSVPSQGVINEVSGMHMNSSGIAGQQSTPCVQPDAQHSMHMVRGMLPSTQPSQTNNLIQHVVNNQHTH